METAGVQAQAWAHLWQRTLAHEGLTDAPAPRVQLWLLEHPLDPHGRDLGLVRRRLAGERVTALARELEWPHSRVQRVTARAGLRVLLPHLEHAQMWRRLRQVGAGPPPGVRADLVDLALDGWPPARALSAEQLLEADRRWQAGQPAEQIAAAVGVSRPWLRQRVTLSPPRWRTREVAAHVGWTTHYLAGVRRAGRGPAPDGVDPQAWWWPATVTTWAADLWRCPVCDHRLPTAKGVTLHQHRVHPPT